MLQDLLLFDIENNSWESQDHNVHPWPPGRCRQGSCIVSHEDGSADMYLLGGWSKKEGNRNDVWKLKLSRKTCCFNFEWTQLPNLKKPTHRYFSFALDGKVFLVGGFGHSLMKLQAIDGLEKNIVTHDLMRLPPNERRAFKDSKSLSGFGAVYDEIEQRLIVVGGGNLGKQLLGVQKNRAFGNIDAQVQSKPRILCLNHNKDTQDKAEWKWKTYDLSESLDTKLPELLSWGACLINHSVILFGGRQGNQFSNEIFKVQLRPEYVTAVKELETMAGILKNKVR